MKVIPEVALDLLFPGLYVPREVIRCREKDTKRNDLHCIFICNLKILPFLFHANAALSSRGALLATKLKCFEIDLVITI